MLGLFPGFLPFTVLLPIIFQLNCRPAPYWTRLLSVGCRPMLNPTVLLEVLSALWDKPVVLIWTVFINASNQHCPMVSNFNLRSLIRNCTLSVGCVKLENGCDMFGLLGAVRLLWGRSGGGLAGFKGGHAKTMASRSRGSWKTTVCKGGSLKHLHSSLVLTATAILQNIPPEC